MSAAPNTVGSTLHPLQAPRARRGFGGRETWLGIVLPGAWLLAAVLGASLAPWLPVDPQGMDLFAILQPPDAAHWFGTDSLGRDIFVRTLYGLRVTFIVGLGSVVIGLSIGSALGMLAGYLRGRFDLGVTAAINILLAFPPMVLIIALMSYPGDPLLKVVLAMGLIFVSIFTRIARINTISFARQEFVTAARAIGMRRPRILLQEIAPNLVAPLMSYALLMVAVAAVAEGSLSFLGLSVPPPTPTLGGMVSAEIANLEMAPHAVFFPALTLFLTVLALNRLGESLQRRLDIRSSAL